VSPVFVTGGTGYIGRALITTLLARHHVVHALVRPGSEGKLPPGTMPINGDALEEASFSARVPRASVVVHLVGTPHPNPAKAAEFRRVDLASVIATAVAAQRTRARHLVYVSVAQPAPIMRAYIAARQEGEAAVRASGVPATILRPWYVLGPGRSWPNLLKPMYAVFRWLPRTRDAAERLDFVTHGQMVAALVRAIEDPPPVGVRIIEVPEIRRATL
jgi:uncharacterized protein YbjT (DUF2867 family)